MGLLAAAMTAEIMVGGASAPRRWPLLCEMENNGNCSGAEGFLQTLLMQHLSENAHLRLSGGPFFNFLLKRLQLKGGREGGSQQGEARQKEDRVETGLSAPY